MYSACFAELINNISFNFLKQHLLVGAGETRMAIHRSKRWYDATEMALGYTLVSHKSV